MKKKTIHTEHLSKTEQELAYPAVVDRKAEIYKQKIRGRSFPHNPYTAEQQDHSNYDHLQPNHTQSHYNEDEQRSIKSNKQVYLNGVPMNVGTSPLRPQNYSSCSPNKKKRYQHQHPSQNPIIVHNNQQVIINGAPQTVVIIKQQQKQAVKDDHRWERDQRIGCCCISAHYNSFCCDYFCLHSCCRCIQGNNLCCYCHSMDCVRCFAHHICRTCCLQKEFCECMLQCCKHMPLCMLIDCLKDSSCCECLINCCKEESCKCLGDFCKNVSCECLNNCEGECMRNICEAVCRGIGHVICCFFK